MSSVYKMKMFCKLCEEAVPIHSYSDDPNFKMIDDQHKELLDHVDHIHWCHDHRLCEICGKVVRGEEFDLVLEKELNFLVNSKYEEWRKYPDRGLLTIHKMHGEK